MEIVERGPDGHTRKRPRTGTQAGLVQSRSDARSLEVVRCRAYVAGAQEPPRPDGSRQLRLPLGAWIVGLRTADELARERARAVAG